MGVIARHARFRRRAAGLFAACLLALSAPAQTAGLFEALTGGKASGQLRYRYKWVDEQGFAKRAKASTLRMQLGHATADYLEFGAFLQFEDVRVEGCERYNSTVNGLVQYPTVADPEETEVNQAYLSFQCSGTTVRYGRQAIAYDNHHFIGDVGWRQNQQTYDAFSLENTSLPDTTISFAHGYNVNRIFGDVSTVGNVRMDGDLLNIAYHGLKAGALVGYGYFLDYRPGQPFAVTASHKNLGLRFDDSTPLGGSKLLYTAEFAKQSNYKGGAATVDAKPAYYGMLGLDVRWVQLKLNYELLSDNDVYDLQTPFATLHAFNSWADKFLTTPVDGLRDVFLSVGACPLGVNLAAVYHRYASDHQDYDYDREWNLLESKKLA